MTTAVAMVWATAAAIGVSGPQMARVMVITMKATPKRMFCQTTFVVARTEL